jgi:capsular exopolysaccharide synthesis family protein
MREAGNVMLDLGWFLTLFRKRGLAGAAVFATVLVSGWIVYRMQPRIYVCRFSVRVMGGEELPSEMKRFENLLKPQFSSADALVDIVRSDKVLEDTMRRANLISAQLSEAERRALLGHLRNSLSINTLTASSLLNVQLSSADPDQAHKLCQSLLDALVNEEIRSRVQKDEEAKEASTKRSDHINSKLAKLELIRERLEKASQNELMVVEKRKERPLLLKAAEEEIARVQADIQKLEQQYSDTWPELRMRRRRESVLRSFGRATGVSAVDAERFVSGASGTPPVIDPSWADEDPELKPWLDKRARLEQIGQEEQELLNAMDAELILSWREDPKFFDLAALNQEVDLFQQALNSENRNRLTLDSKIATTVSNLRTMESPVRPTAPASPNPNSFGVMVAMLALMAAVMVIYMLEYFDPALRTVESIEHFTHQNVISLIPYIEGEAARQGYPCRMVYKRNGEGTLQADPYRILKTNVDYAIANVANPVVLVTSATREEGKSTTAVNLAFAFAEERKTLLISSNMRRPVAHLFFEKPMESGLVDVLEGRLPWEEAIQRTQVPNLHLVTSGRIVEHSSVLLNRPAFHQMLDQARQRYDIVVMDSPPLLLVTDAMVIAPKVDAVVLVYAIGQTDKKTLFRAIEILGHIKAKLVGIAANAKGIVEGPSPRRYYYHSPAKK